MTVIYTRTLNTSNNWSGQSDRLVISQSTGGNQIRIRVQSDPSNAISVSNCAVGIATGTQANTAATPVEILFGGGHGYSLSAGAADLTSDWTSITVGATDMLIVIVDGNVAPVAPGYTGDGAGSSYYVVGTSYNSASPAGQTSYTIRAHVNQVEIQTVGSGSSQLMMMGIGT